jgi:hypothetical protein
MDFQIRPQLSKRRVPVVHCRRAAIDAVLQSALEMTLDEVERRIDEDLEPRSRQLAGWRIVGEVSLRRAGRPLKNVVATLEGQGPSATEAIVIGAHYDHLGKSRLATLDPSRTVHNGADDNASGTAVLLEVGRQLAARRRPPARTLVFIAFTAEEIGLVGSEYYAQHPLVPLEQTIAMLNLDMVGRLRNRTLIVQGIDTAVEFDSLVAQPASEHDLRIDRWSGGFGFSDHTSFYAQGVPVMHFFTGLHRDYHRPSDDYEKLNYQGMRQIAQIVTDVVADLADAETSLQPASPDMLAGDLLGLLFPIRDAGGAERAYLGVTSDPRHTGPGYAVARIVTDSAAERAGLEPGDIILRLDDVDVRQGRDLPDAVRGKKPGDRVTLTIRRGGVRRKLQATLGRR